MSFKGGLDSGVTIYRYYIDGEDDASIVFTPRDVAGVRLVQTPCAMTSPAPPLSLSLSPRRLTARGFHTHTAAPLVVAPDQVIFDPIGECNDPSCTHPAPGTSRPVPTPGTKDATRRDEYVIGGRGATCDAACAVDGRHCNPIIEPNGQEATGAPGETVI